MSGAEFAYYCFIFASAGISIVSFFVIVMGSIDLRRERGSYDPLNARHQARKWITIAGIVSATLLFPLFGFGALHVWHLTPEQFVIEFNNANYH